MAKVKTFGKTTVELLNIDIVEVPVEVVVNAANTRLWLGGGVAGAIRRVAGDQVQVECDRHGPVASGTVVVTGAGRHSARHIFHAAVSEEPDLFSSMPIVEEALTQIVAKIGTYKVRSIAVPLLGAGVGGLDGQEVLREIVRAFELHGRRSGQELRVVIAVKDPSEFAKIKPSFDAYVDADTERKQIDQAALEMIRKLERNIRKPPDIDRKSPAP